jgi:ammonia channel protein AmtB
VVHALGGWIALPAVLLLGARHGRYTKEGLKSTHPPSNIPFLALGAWILAIGWLKKSVGIRLDPEQEYMGADLAIHKVSATPD